MADFELPGYDVFERIGRGGMAAVYRALHLNLDREVAIKVMDPSMNSDETFSERFIREARISARLIHPHILQIYDVNTFDGLNYIAMELLGAGELADFIHSDMPQKQIYQILEQMTDALDYASGRGYVHRDIKPSNIMLRDEGDFVLADFGIARAANSGTQMTQTGLMVGTPSYMSPEQAKGLEVDGRSDLYAVAVLCFEMLTKTLPYESDSAVTTAVKHLTEDIPTLPEHLAAYQEFIDKGLAKEPGDRFQTGREMYQAFMEASAEFEDDQVLTPGIEAPKRPATGSRDRASLSDNDSTRLSGSSRPMPSRPYKLDGTNQRERLVSGTYASSDKSGGGAIRWVIAIAVVAGLGFGGYQYWQTQQASQGKELQDVASTLASAYAAMNDNKLELAARSFSEVLKVDRNNNAATTGMRELEGMIEQAVSEAVDSKDISSAESLIGTLSDYYANNSKLEAFQADLEVLRGDAPQLGAQSERAVQLLNEATDALAEGELSLARNALEQAMELAPESSEIGWAMRDLEEAERQSQVIGEAWSSLSPVERDEFELALANAEKALSSDDLDGAADELEKAAAIAPDAPSIELLQDQLTQSRQALAESALSEQKVLDAMLAEADAARDKLAADPASGATAVSAYRAVLEKAPQDERALAGMDAVADYYVSAAEAAASEGDFESADQIISRVENLLPESTSVSEFRKSLPAMEQAYSEKLAVQEREAAEAQKREQEEAAKQQQQLAEVVARGERAISSGALNIALEAFRELESIAPENQVTLEFRNKLVEAYSAAARNELDSREYDAALEYVSQGRALAPEESVWASLEEEVDTSRNSARRRLGAF